LGYLLFKVYSAEQKREPLADVVNRPLRVEPGQAGPKNISKTSGWKP